MNYKKTQKKTIQRKNPKLRVNLVEEKNKNGHIPNHEIYIFMLYNKKKEMKRKKEKPSDIRRDK